MDKPKEWKICCSQKDRIDDTNHFDAMRELLVSDEENKIFSFINDNFVKHPLSDDNKSNMMILQQTFIIQNNKGETAVFARPEKKYNDIDLIQNIVNGQSIMKSFSPIGSFSFLPSISEAKNILNLKISTDFPIDFQVVPYGLGLVSKYPRKLSSLVEAQEQGIIPRKYIYLTYLAFGNWESEIQCLDLYDDRRKHEVFLNWHFPADIAVNGPFDKVLVHSFLEPQTSYFEEPDGLDMVYFKKCGNQFGRSHKTIEFPIAEIRMKQIVSRLLNDYRIAKKGKKVSTEHDDIYYWTQCCLLNKSQKLFNEVSQGYISKAIQRVESFLKKEGITVNKPTADTESKIEISSLLSQILRDRYDVRD